MIPDRHKLDTPPLAFFATAVAPVLATACANPAIAAEYNIYGEAAGITSRLPPSSAIDTVVNEFMTTNLGVASTVLLADVLAAAERYLPPLYTIKISHCLALL